MLVELELLFNMSQLRHFSVFILCVLGEISIFFKYQWVSGDISVLAKLDGTTHPCSVDQCAGGVGRNMAEALWRLRGGGVRLLTAVGDDADGQYLADVAPGLLLDGCIIKDARTATYAAVLDARGECKLGLGDMAVHNHITPALVNKHVEVLKQAPLVVVDGNIPQSTMDFVLHLCNSLQKPVFFEPTDRRKALKALKRNHHLTYASPNVTELRAMASFLYPEMKFISDSTDTSEILRLSKILSHYIKFIIVTMGCKGVVTAVRHKNNLECRLYPVEVLHKTLNVSGAGDCFASGFIYGTLLGQSPNSCLSLGFQAAKSALLSKTTVPSNLQINIKKITEIESIKLDIADELLK